MPRSLSTPLYERLLRHFPADRAYTHSDWDDPAMPSPVRHFLEQQLRHQSRHEAQRLHDARSSWVDYEHPEMERMLRRFFATMEDHMQVPRDAWPATLEQATHYVTAYLVRPVPVVISFVFGEQAGPLSLKQVLWRMKFFNEYTYLREAVQAYATQREVTSFSKGVLAKFLRRLDARITEDYSVERWQRLLSPLYKLARTATDRATVPVALLQNFFEEKDARSIAQALERAQSNGYDALDRETLGTLLRSQIEPSRSPRTSPPLTSASSSSSVPDAPTPSPSRDRPDPRNRPDAQDAPPSQPSSPSPNPAPTPDPPASSSDEPAPEPLPDVSPSKRPASLNDDLRSTPPNRQHDTQEDAQDTQDTQDTPQQDDEERGEWPFTDDYWPGDEDEKSSGDAEDLPEQAFDDDPLGTPAEDSSDTERSEPEPATSDDPLQRPGRSEERNDSQRVSRDDIFGRRRERSASDSSPAEPSREPAPEDDASPSADDSDAADDRPWAVAGPARPAGSQPSASSPPEDDESTPLWKRFQQGGARNGPTETPTSASESGDTPLWARFQQGGAQAESPAPSSASSEASASSDPSPSESSREVRPATASQGLEALEKRVLGQSNPPHRAVYVRQLFGGSMDAYRQTLEALDDLDAWNEASQLIARDVFRAHKVNIYSDAAVQFTNAVEARFRA